MERDKLRILLDQVHSGECSTADALERLALAPYSEMGMARVDHHRSLRCGFAEVIFAAGKTADDVVAILKRGLERCDCMLATRVNEQQAALIKKKFRAVNYNPRARTVCVGTPRAMVTTATVAVVAAGTSDMPVAEEALETLKAFGCPCTQYYDVGVAGLHRLLDTLPGLRAAHAIIAVAGMEGALPSVVGGLVASPVIAVPTSVGYGTSFNGLAALLAMLNSCASGVSVVNIDNGFGAAMCALRIVSQFNEKSGKHKASESQPDQATGHSTNGRRRK